MHDNKQLFIKLLRHRILTDGQGVTTLAIFHGCPLDCKYCLNPRSKEDIGNITDLICHTPESLIDEIRKDDLYFKATGGGICFGGGEPLLRPNFIIGFREICPPEWNITIETSLNVPLDNITATAACINEWIVDIKDLNPLIYRAYTGKENTPVIAGLKWLVNNGYGDRVAVRVPLIPGFNNEDDLVKTESILKEMGINKTERFKYALPSELKREKEERRNHPNEKYGKRVCAILKCIRQLIADRYGITFTSNVCKHTGPCMGTCPACEQEVFFLGALIREQVKEGEPII